MEKRVIKVNERLPLLMSLPLSLQHLFAMFGATILVPFLFKADPTTCIFLNGVGTLIYIFLTKGKVPAYLGSSFAVISPVLLVLQTMPYSAAQGGFVVFGLIYLAFALLIKKIGTGWIDVIFQLLWPVLPTRFLITHILVWLSLP
jgi:uracil permease